jgi:hypothetical protein
MIHALPTRGRVLHHGGEKDGYSVQGENLSLHAFVQGEHAFMLLKLFVLPESCFLHHGGEKDG